MAEIIITIPIDAELKKQGDVLFNRLGLDMVKAITMFVRKTVEDEMLPFDVNNDVYLDGPYTKEEDALLYSPSNVAAILESVRKLDEGKKVLVSLDELEAMIK